LTDFKEDRCRDNQDDRILSERFPMVGSVSNELSLQKDSYVYATVTEQNYEENPEKMKKNPGMNMRTNWIELRLLMR